MEMHDRLENLRERRGVSARELARQIGMKSDSTVWRWLNGAQEPRLSEAVKLAVYFGVSLDELAGREPGPSDLTPGEQQLLRIVRRLGEEEAERRLLLLTADEPAQKHGPPSVMLPPRVIEGAMTPMRSVEPREPAPGEIAGELTPVKRKGRKKPG